MVHVCHINVLRVFLIVHGAILPCMTWQVGDWTKDLFRLGLEQDRLPLWITAAQPSLMEKSIYYDNSKTTDCCPVPRRHNCAQCASSCVHH